MSVDFLVETWQSRKEKNDIFNLMKKKNPTNQE